MSRQGTVVVESKGKPVGNATFPIYDSVEEALAARGPTFVVKATNAAEKTKARNAVRSEATGIPSESKFRELGQALFIKSPDAAAKFAEVQASSNAEEAYEMLMESYISQAKDKWFAEHPDAERPEED